MRINFINLNFSVQGT